VKILLTKLDLEKIRVEIENELRELPKSSARVIKLRKRLQIIKDLLLSGNDPTWMVLNVLPVIPPELRPMIQIEGGRFATTDLNDLYRRVINRNNRLEKLMKLNAPEVIVRNEKRMLQQAVDALIYNGRMSKAITDRGGRPLKSLTDLLKGKKGRFRRNLLGKRVDEALGEIDQFIDDAVLAGLSPVRIVHGKGTGALRKATHEYLSRDKRVLSFRLGGDGEGGDGVTVAELRPDRP